MSIARSTSAAALAGVLAVATLAGGVAASADSQLPGQTEAPQLLDADAPLQFDAKTVSRAPVIDGSLADSVWDVSTPIGKSIPETSETKSPTHQADFDATWDYQNLYVAVHVTGDDDLIDGTAWGAGDIVSLFVDGTNHKSEPYTSGDLQLGIGLNQQDNFAPHILFGGAPGTGLTEDDQTSIRDSIEAVTVPTDDGWDAEIAVPWQQLGIDSYLTRTLGFDISADNKRASDAGTTSELAIWETNDQTSFWNSTAGFGTLVLADDERENTDSSVIYSEDFDGIADGDLPANVASASGTEGWSVQGGKLVGDFSAAGSAEQRLLLPALGDNVTVDADVTFESVVNAARWASVIYRSAPDDSLGYYHFTNRLDGRGEITEKSKDNQWKAFVNAPSTGALQLGEAYHSAITAFGQQLHHLRTGGGSDNSLDLSTDAATAGVVDASQLRSNGRVGVQVDQAKASFDNIEVKQLSIDALAAGSSVPDSVQQYTAIDPSAHVTLSNGDSHDVSGDEVRAYSSDANVVTVRDDGTLVANQEGTATLTLIIGGKATTKQITVTHSDDVPPLAGLTLDNGKDLAEQFVDGSLTLADVKLTGATVLGTEQQLDGSDASLAWTSSDPAVASVDGDRVTFGAKGLVRLTAKSGDATAALDVWVRADENDLTYVDEDFDGGDALPAYLQTKYGSTSSVDAVGDGQGTALQLAPSTRVLIPNITSRNDYTIEADVTYKDAANDARWGSLMYRVQNQDYPYFQMAVRRDATAVNGVEFAHRTPANGWDVRETASYSEPIDASKTYHFSVTVTGDKVKESIDGQQMIFTDKAGDYEGGDLGFQSDNLTMIVDNLKVTMSPADLGPVPHLEDRDVPVKQATTNIVGTTPVISTSIRSLDDVSTAIADDITSELQVDLRTENGALAVYEGDARIGTFDEFIDAAYSKILILTRVDDQQTVDLLSAAIGDQDLSDLEVVSANGELLKSFREQQKAIRSGLIVDDDQITADEVGGVVAATNTSRSKHVIVRQSAVTKAVVEELQRRALSVTVVADDSAASHAAALTAGADSIVTGAPAVARRVVDQFDQNSLLRRIFTIGHRGTPSNTTENSISGYRMAVEEFGADMVETDVYVTKDDQVVILHDATFNRTTDIATTTALDDSVFTGGVTRENAQPKDLTLEQIRKLKLKDPSGTVTDEPVPTLEELLDFVDEHDVVLFLELKDPTSPEIEQRTAERVQAKGVADKIVFISFNQNEIPTIQQLLPGNSVGNLQGIGTITPNRPMETLHKVAQYLAPQNAVYDASYAQIGGTDSTSEDNRSFVFNAHARHMTLWGWTYADDGDKGNFEQSMLLGINGLTTNDAQWTKDAYFGITAADAEYSLDPGQSVTLAASAETNVGATVAIDNPSIVVVDGADALRADGSTLTAVDGASGTATVLLKSTEQILGATYTVYSEPITVTVGDGGHGGDNGDGADDGSGNDGAGDGDQGDGSQTGDQSGTNGSSSNGAIGENSHPQATDGAESDDALARTGVEAWQVMLLLGFAAAALVGGVGLARRWRR